MPFSNHSRRRKHWRGATLIEVLAGLVVLGTVLSAVVIARGRFVRQWAVAEQRLDAVRAADGLLEQWSSGGGWAVPTRDEGLIGESYLWRTMPVGDESARKLDAVVVRLELYRRGSGARPVLAMELLASAQATTQPSGRER
jgi:hypothetical protein